MNKSRRRVISSPFPRSIDLNNKTASGTFILSMGKITAPGPYRLREVSFLRLRRLSHMNANIKRQINDRAHPRHTVDAWPLTLV